jgi:hypothetical protein
MRMARCAPDRDRRNRSGDDTSTSGDDTSTALARIPLVGYDFAKKNTIAEKGELA